MRKKGSGFGDLFSLVKTIVWVLFVMGLLLAALQTTGVVSIDEALTSAKSKATYYAECIPDNECGLASIIQDIGSGNSDVNPGNGSSPHIGEDLDIIIPDKIDGDIDYNAIAINRETRGYRGPDEGEPYVNRAGLVNKHASLGMLEEIATVSDKEDKGKDVGYDRSEWKHWTSTEGRSCWTTRDEILYRDAIPGSLVFIDKQRQPTIEYSEACAIGRPVVIDGKNRIDTEDSGEWIDPYTGKKMTSTSEIDIDHVIPLSNAARNNGQEWSAELKEQFANDPDNLLATSAKANRSKGDKGPGKYMPSNMNYKCQYAKTYTSISYKYDLAITESDYVALKKALELCQH